MKQWLILLVLLAATAQADPGSVEADVDALALADLPSAPCDEPHDWSLQTETAVGHRQGRAGMTSESFTRVSLDLAIDSAVSERLRALLSSRLDLSWGTSAGRESINTLKEAYVSFKASPGLLLDAGRINTRFGVAHGYNPSDFFRAHAVRSLISIDPETLRQNRLGSAMLRSQWLWDQGSLTALYSPRIDSNGSEKTFDPDWEATNERQRYLFAASRRLTPWLSPELLLYGREGLPPVVGLNGSVVLGDATVLHAEWSGGRGPLLVAEAMGEQEELSFHSRFAGGLRHTTAHKDTLSLEYHYNGAAPDEGQWNSMRHGPQAAFLAYRQFALDMQDLPTRHGAFLHYRRQDLGLDGLDLSAMARVDLNDHSALYWLQLRQAWKRCELSVSGRWNGGQPQTVYGAFPERSVFELMLRFYL